MAILSKPLHRPTLSSLSIEKGFAQPLLGREITLYFGGIDKKKNSVITTVGEIFQRCQKTLCAEFGPITRLFIKGSSVATLFSKEPFCDIDIHTTIDVTDLPPSRAVGRGYAIKWAVLKAIAEIISEKFSLCSAESNTSIPTESILCQEENACLFSQSVPYNVHTIRLPGSVPVEFTMFNIINPVQESVRSYDFNCGSLTLDIDKDGQVTIHSYTTDIYRTIQEVKDRELTCLVPEELSRKGVCRYLGRLVLGGYSDKDPELLHTLITCVKSSDKGPKDDKILTTRIVKEIITHFEDKGVSPGAPLLSLWLLRKPDPCPEMFEALLEEVKCHLKSSWLTDPVLERQAISTLVRKGKKTECFWYLLMQSKSVRQVLHRGEESLQLEIPCYPIFANDPSDRSVFIIVPTFGVTKVFECALPQAFFAIEQEGKLPVQVEGNESKELLQNLCKNVLMQPSLYPVLVTALGRFGMEMGLDLSKNFISWVNALSDEEIQKIPLPILIQAFETLKEDQPLENPIKLSLLRRLHTLKGEEGSFSFESLPMQSIIACYTLLFLKEEALWESLSREDQRVIIDFVKGHLKKYCNQQQLEVYQITGHSIVWTRTLNLLYILYQKNHAPLSKIMMAAELSLDSGHLVESVKLLEAVARKEPALQLVTMQSVFEKFSASHPLEYAKFLKKNGFVLKEKIEGFNRCIFLPFVENVIKDQVLPELGSICIELIQAFCDAPETQTITKTLFQGASRGNGRLLTFFQQVSDGFSLSARSFDWIVEMDVNELDFLSQQRDFDRLFANDPEFAITLIRRAALLGNTALVTQGTLHLTKTDPDRCLEALAILDSMRKDLEDLTTLFPSLNALVQLLEIYPGLMIDPSCKSFIDARLVDLLRYLTLEEKEGDTVLEGPAFNTIREFHKKVALYTIESPCWEKIWNMVDSWDSSEENKAIKKWINPEDLFLLLEFINPSGGIIDLIDVFTLDGPFIYQVIQQISALPESSHEDFFLLIEVLLLDSGDAILRQAPQQPPADAVAAISLIRKFFPVCEPDEEDISHMIDMQMAIACFTLAYGPKEERLKCLMEFDRLYQSDKEPIKVFLEETSLPHQCLFLSLKRCLAAVDFETFSFIQSSYLLWGKSKTPYEYLTLEDLDSQCIQWMECLKSCFADPALHKTFTAESPGFAVLQFYSRFLVESIKGCPSARQGVSSIVEKKFNDVSFLHLLQLMDFLKKKKSIKSPQFIADLANLLEYFDDGQLDALIRRFLYMGINILQEMPKQGIKQEDFVPFMSLLTSMSVFLYGAEESGTIEIPSDAIAQFLEAAWIVFPHFIAKYPSFENCMRAFSMMQSGLNLKDLTKYHFSWGQGILGRKGSTHPAELGGWFVLSLILTPDVSELLFSGELRKWDGKRFITAEYFKSPTHINAFLEIIDLALERFPVLFRDEKQPIMRDGEDIDVLRFLGVNLFKLLFFYSNWVQAGIAEIQRKPVTKSEGIRLEMMYRKILVKYLEIPKSVSTSCSLLYLWPKITDNLKGQIIFRKSPGLTAAEQVKMLYLIVQNLPLIKKEEQGSIQPIIKGLNELYASGKSTIESILSASEIKAMHDLTAGLLAGQGHLALAGSIKRWF